MAASPVLLMVFNRPDFAEATASIVAKHGRPKVYLACDGPRNPAEVAVVSETLARTRAVLRARGVHVEELVREHNLGCKRAVEQAISWFFSTETEGIVLEDDCHPSSSFFEFCDAMLERYRDDERVMHISGYSEDAPATNSYRFSRLPAVWGWATWRRAWHHYATALPALDAADRRLLGASFARREHLDFFVNKWALVRKGSLDSWGFSWVYAVRSQNGLAVQPRTNLVVNSGVGDPRAAHTTRTDRAVVSNVGRDIDMTDLVRPTAVLPDDAADHRFFRRRMAGRLAPARAVVRRVSAHRPTISW